MASWTGIFPFIIALNTLLTSCSVSSGWKWYLLHTPLGCFLGPLLLWQSVHFWKLLRKSTYVRTTIELCSVLSCEETCLKAMKTSLAVVKVCRGWGQSDQLPYLVFSRDRAQPWLEDHPGEQLLVPVPCVSWVVSQTQAGPVSFYHAFWCPLEGRLNYQAGYCIFKCSWTYFIIKKLPPQPILHWNEYHCKRGLVFNSVVILKLILSSKIWVTSPLLSL